MSPAVPRAVPRAVPCGSSRTDSALPALQSPELLSLVSLAAKTQSFALHGPSSLCGFSLWSSRVSGEGGGRGITNSSWLGCAGDTCPGTMDSFHGAAAGERLPNPFAAWPARHLSGRQGMAVLPFVPLAAADRSLLGSKVRPLQPLGTDLFSLSGCHSRGGDTETAEWGRRKGRSLCAPGSSDLGVLRERDRAQLQKSFPGSFHGGMLEI